MKILGIKIFLSYLKTLTSSMRMCHASIHNSHVRIFQTQQMVNTETRGLGPIPILGGVGWRIPRPKKYIWSHI